ncbi:MAG: oligogalacturonate lyase family protein [Halobacteriaceae archaeon]
MTRGRTLPPEASVAFDRRTGATIRQVTDDRSVTHHPYFFNPPTDAAGDWLVVVSHRTGTPEVYGEDRSGGGGGGTDAPGGGGGAPGGGGTGGNGVGGELVQFTDDDVDEWSVVPGPDGDAVFVTAGGRACRVDTDTCETAVLVDFPAALDLPPGVAAADVSTGGATGLDPAGERWAVPVSVGEEHWLTIVDTASGAFDVVLRRDVAVQPQFCPDDPDLLFHAGPLTDRVWVLDLPAALAEGPVDAAHPADRRLYERKEGEWITHESWLPGRREVAFVDWPNGVRARHVDTGVERRVTDCNAWHAVASPDGDLMVADTNFPRNGLQLFDPRDGVAKTRTLCYPAASSIGEHWDGPFPYADGPIETYSPQHTHPHPAFTPEGETVVYTSDRSGFANVYEVAVPERTPTAPGR